MRMTKHGIDFELVGWNFMTDNMFGWMEFRVNSGIFHYVSDSGIHCEKSNFILNEKSDGVTIDTSLLPHGETLDDMSLSDIMGEAIDFIVTNLTRGKS